MPTPEWFVAQYPIEGYRIPLQVYRSPRCNPPTLLYAVSPNEMGARYTIVELRAILAAAEVAEQQHTGKVQQQ